MPLDEQPPPPPWVARHGTSDIFESSPFSLVTGTWGEARMLGTAPSAIQFKTAITGIAIMKPGMGVAETIRDVKMSVADQTNKNGCRPAVRQRLHFVPLYGRLVVEAVLEGIWQEDSRGRVITSPLSRDLR